MRIVLLVSLALGLAIGSLPGQGPADPAPDPTVEAPVEPAVPRPDPVLGTLRGLIDSIANLRIEQTAARKEIEELKIAGAETTEIKAAEEKPKRLAEELAKLQLKFEELAAGSTDASFEEGAAEDVNLQNELKILLEPMIYELRKSTARPREIERLRNDVAIFERRQQIAETSLARLQSMLDRAADPILLDELERLRDGWLARKGRVKSELDAARLQLDEALGNQESLVAILGRVLSDFFARRGKSFALAILGALGTFFLFVMVVRVGERYLPDTDELRRSLAFRMARMIFLTLAVLCAIFAFLGILYTQSDWLLLGLSLIFIVGFLWAAKQALLPFYQQLKTILNLGPVREGERVIFDGIPWEVKSINFYTDLVNPMLTGGHVRVAIGDLTDLHSRPKARKEPLFPCKVGEWVMLSDGTYGTVLSQTPELVRLRTVPGSVVSYQTTSFLGLAPDNHSDTFGLRVSIGVDYQHQPISTTEVREKLEAHIKQGLTEIAGEDNLRAFWVEFASAGASSLDYTVGATFDGSLAGRKPSLERATQRLFVDACNKNGWVIPFTQVTIHQAS